MIIVHYPIDTELTAEAVPKARLARKILDRAEPIPPGAVWIDMVEPTGGGPEGRALSRLPGCPRTPTPISSSLRILLAENGVRYLHASVVSEAENTPDVVEVTFILASEELRHPAL